MKVEIGYDRIDNAIHDFLESIAGKELEWNMRAIGEVRDSIEESLKAVYDIDLTYLDDSICQD